MEHADHSLTKIPPHSLEAEQAVLGGILGDNDKILEVQKILSANSFYIEAHRKIFLAIADAFKERGSVDLVILTDELRKKGQIEKIGGSAYICSLVDNVASSLLVGHYAEIVKRKDILRKIIGNSSEIANIAYDDREPLEAILAKWQSILADLLRQSALEETSQKLGMPLEQMNLYFASCRETPFELLNRAIGGLFGGELIIIGARPGMGKSALAHGFLRHTAIQEGRPVIYFGAEMSREVIYARQLAAMCKIPYNDLKRGRVNAEQAEALLVAHKKIDLARINRHIIKDKISAISLMVQVRKFADEVKEEIGLVIVENLQQITWPGKTFRVRKDEADIIMGALKPFGLEMKVPIIISCQINRDPDEREDKHPMLSDLKDTGQIEEVADKILLLFRPNYYDKQPTEGPEKGELIIGKGGPPISLPFKFFGTCLYWEEARGE